MFNADRDQFLTDKETTALLEAVSDPSLTAEAFVPTSPYPGYKNEDEPGEKLVMLRFSNGFVSSGGRLAASIDEHGKKKAMWYLYCEMVFGGYLVPWWVLDKYKP